MEAGLSEVKSELQSRDDLLRIIEMERLQLHRELLKLGESQSTQENKKRYIVIFSNLRRTVQNIMLKYFESFMCEIGIKSLFCVIMLLIIR